MVNTFSNEVIFMRTMYLSKIKKRIAEMDNGSVITIGNFLDIANYDAVKMHYQNWRRGMYSLEY